MVVVVGAAVVVVVGAAVVVVAGDNWGKVRALVNDKGEYNETLVAMIRQNVRIPDVVMGDLNAQLAPLLNPPHRADGQHRDIRRCFRRRDRLHSLGDPDLFADSGVTQSAGTDLTGDHFSGIQTDTQPQRDAGFEFRRKLFGHVLNTECRQTGP